MKTAKRIVSIIFLISAIVSLVTFIIFLFLTNVIVPIVIEALMRIPEIDFNSDPEAIQLGTLIYVITIGVMGSQISIGQIVVTSINLKTLDRDLSRGQLIGLTIANYLFDLIPLFVMYLIDTIRYGRHPKVVVAEE